MASTSTDAQPALDLDALEALLRECDEMRRLILAGTDIRTNGFTPREAIVAMQDAGALMERVCGIAPQILTALRRT